MPKLTDTDALRKAVRDDPNIDGLTYARIMRHIIEAKREDAVPVVHGRWIPVTERLPEMLYDYTHDAFGETFEVYRSKPVLASDGREVCTVEWVRFSEGEILMEVSRLDGGEIEPTYWMPLPEPPKEVE